MATKQKAKVGKKQEKDATFLDAMEKFAVDNKDLPKFQQIIVNYDHKNDKLKDKFYEIKQKMQLTQRENVLFSINHQ